jgi:non-heme chloroperoxidase
MKNLQEHRRETRRASTIPAAALALGVLALGLAAAAHGATAADANHPIDTTPSGADAGARHKRIPLEAGAAAVVRHQRIRLGTGVELHVAEAGPATGVPVVFLHGITDSWFSWSRVLEHLPAGVRAIVPTQRGHGDSERPECCYAVSDFAADVDALLAALAIDRAHVVGHSMGGVIAQRVAITYPHRVDRLVIVSSAADVRNDGVIEFHGIVRQLTDPVDTAFIREFQAGTAALPLPPAFLDTVVAESAKLPARVWQDVLGGLVAEESAHDISRIAAPTLVVWGAQDAFFGRADQQRLVRGIAGARLLTYPDAAHSPNWEIPGVLARDVWRFLGVAP